MKKNNTLLRLNQTEIAEELKRLRMENAELKKLVNSKRFKFAEKLATKYNAAFPVATKRRKLASAFLRKFSSISAEYTKKLDKKSINELRKAVKNYDKIFVISSIDWDTKLRQRPHHLAEAFTKLGFFVVYLEKDNKSCRLRKIKKNLVTINDRKYLDGILLNKKGWFLTNNLLASKEEFDWAHRQGFSLVYDYLDAFDESIKNNLIHQLEVWELLPKIKPKLILATAQNLYNHAVSHMGSSKGILFAPNAVNADHFDFTKNTNAAPPVDLTSIIFKKHPIIGFYGALAPWIDFNLLNDTARNHPEWEFVYIGFDYGGAAAELEKLPNVHNLGHKNYEELPSYSIHFDCAIIPFKTGEIAKSTSPVKLFEYMAAGLPVVCTKDLIECSGYDYVYMSKNFSDFQLNIKRAITAHKKLSIRKALLLEAKGHTWQKCAKNIADSILQ